MTTLSLEKIIGPPVPEDLKRRHGLRFVLPGLFLGAARVLVLVSLFLPYWHMTLHAPQYPEGLHLTAYINHLTGDVSEIDALNHYIGMKPLHEAAKFERAWGVYGLIALVLLMEAAARVHNWWAALMTIPAVLFPVFFLIDLHCWLKAFGNNLDPAAPLSSAIKPFTPPVLGSGAVGQFETVAAPGVGLYMVTAAAVVILIALFFHRRAYRPLVLAARSRS